jgi:hypothetical protein
MRGQSCWREFLKRTFKILDDIKGVAIAGYRLLVVRVATIKYLRPNQFVMG